MFLKKYGLGKPTENKFKKIHGINLKAKQTFLKSSHKINFNHACLNTLTNIDLFNNVINNIQFYKDIKSFRGSRHRKNYPVRGQRTHTNTTPKIVKKNNLW